MGLFESVRRPAKSDPAELALALSLPPPTPQEKTSTTYPCTGFPPKIRKQTRTGSIRNTYFKSSCQHTGTTTVTNPVQPG